MQKIIIIKYGELTTKKDNIGLFLSALKTNVENSLSGMNTHINFDKGRMFVEAHDNNYDKVLEKLQKVFGIYTAICFVVRQFAAKPKNIFLTK